MSREIPTVAPEIVVDIRGQLQTYAEDWRLATSAETPADEAARARRMKAVRNITHEAILMLFPNYLVDTQIRQLYDSQSVDVTVTVPKIRRPQGSPPRGFARHMKDVARGFDLLRDLGIVYEKYEFMNKKDCVSLTLGVNDER